MTSPSVMEQILDLARWAPSGDNTQVWRFEIIGDKHLVVHGYDTRSHCVYDLTGHPSQIALGTLMETISIAASAHGLETSVVRRLDAPETQSVFDVYFNPGVGVRPSPLIPFIPQRTVQRRAMHTRPLSAAEKKALEEAVGSEYHILWIEGLPGRFKMARLMFSNAKLRLTMPEAYEVHRSIIEWNARYSEAKVPDQALGLDPLTLKLMHWVMDSWKRVQFFNTFLAGTLAPRIQLDFVPGLACAAHFLLLAKYKPATIDDYVLAGRAVQRFWLTLTSLNLYMQPEMTPLIFRGYARDHLSFSKVQTMHGSAKRLADRLDAIVEPQNPDLAVFMGRIGAATAPTARSLRLPLKQLLWKSEK